MNPIRINLEQLKNKTIPIGREGENEYTIVRIDCGKVFAEHPQAEVSMKVKPPKGIVYQVTVERDGNEIVWTVHDYDLASKGDGQFQLTFTDGTVICKTAIGRTLVLKSLEGNGPAPTPIDDWMQEAQEALDAVEDAEVNQPVIGEDGYWYTWNQEAGEYQKTDTKAQGEAGPQGPAGPQGETGPQGPAGDPTTLIDDTSTAADKAWSAAKSNTLLSALSSMESELHGVLVEGEEGETVTVINVDNSYNLYDLGFRNGFNRAYADGVVTYTVDGTNATPQVNYQNARGDKKWVIGFKYKISKIDPAFDDDGTIRIYLGTTQYNESIVWGEWINFEKTVTLDLTRIYLILRSFASTPASNSIKLEVKELYVYDGTNISTEMCEYIHQEQHTNYQDGTVTYGEVTEVYVPDDTLTQSKKAADAKATGDAINEVSEVINGELVDSINLFNKSDPDIISGGYIDKTGVQQTLANYNESGFIPCEHGDTLTLTKSGAYFIRSRDIVFYDENKQFVSGDTGIMPTITVSGSSKKYIRFPIKNDELDVTMIVKNDTAIHDYVPYGKIPTGGLTERVTNLDRPWEGKNVVLLGDSITYNDGHNGLHGYPYYLEPIGFSTITNKGVNGACVAYHEGRQYESICTTVDSVNFASYDLVTIAGGINDYNTSSATPIGSLVNSVTLTDFDKTTFIGALQYIITKILTSNAKIKIALFTPLKKTNWYDTNSESIVLKDYADAIKEVAEYYSIPVLDFYSISGFNRMNLSEYTSDGLHPNNDGYKFICKNKLVDFIRGL